MQVLAIFNTFPVPDFNKLLLHISPDQLHILSRPLEDFKGQRLLKALVDIELSMWRGAGEKSVK